MSGFDFWRPPIGDLLSDEEGEGEVAAPAEVVAPAPVFAPPPRRRVDESPLMFTLERSTLLPGSQRPDPQLTCLDLDDAAVAQAGLPVRLASMPEYLRSLTVTESKAIHHLCSVHTWHLAGPGGPDVPKALARRRLAQVFGPEALPKGLASRLEGPNWSSIEADGIEADLSTPPLALPTMDPSICGQLGPVPTLPNPFTLATDCPVLLAEILKDIPPEEWDSKRFLEPIPVDGMPGLLHGPGGLLSPLTPRQLANNLLAASLVNRLCANLLISVGRVCQDYAAEKRVSPEDLAVLRARSAVKEAEQALQQARQEATEAQECLRSFLQSCELDADRQRHLQSVVGWKTSAAEQSSRELQEAQEALKLAQTARAEAATAPSMSWTQKWATIAPAKASEGEVFAVRLAETGPLLYSLWDFIDAMQHGLVDRTRGSYVPKHALEVAFVRSAADHLLLCTQDEKGFVHLPAPLTVSTGLSLEALWPLHGLALRLEGQTFPFSLHLAATDQRPWQFRGMGLDALSYQTPWNALEYGDVLWASEAQDTLLLVPLLIVLSDLVLDPNLPLGPFEALPNCPSTGLGDRQLPMTSASLAVLQAALFNDVKMWPVALPAVARARYDFALRYLKLACQKVEEHLGSRLPGAEALRPELLTRCLEALEKVPDDGDGSGGTFVRGVLDTACSGFADRVKRMELSALQVPLKGCTVLDNAVQELLQLWPKFLSE